MPDPFWQYRCHCKQARRFDATHELKRSNTQNSDRPHDRRTFRKPAQLHVALTEIRRDRNFLHLNSFTEAGNDMLVFFAPNQRRDESFARSVLNASNDLLVPTFPVSESPRWLMLSMNIRRRSTSRPRTPSCRTWDREDRFHRLWTGYLGLSRS